jgi:hypothetical protein
MRRMVVGRKETRKKQLPFSSGHSPSYYALLCLILKLVVQFASGRMVLSTENTLLAVDSDETVVRRNEYSGVRDSRNGIVPSKCLFVRQAYEKVY